MEEHFYAVIMAGGGGTRLWPLSRQTRPKQMLKLFDDRTLFQTAVDRLGGLFPSERILVVTVEEQAKELHTQCPYLPFENFLIEPMPRGTASVVGLAAAALQKRDPEAVMAVLTADHYIGNEENFRSLLLTGGEVARDGYLVTLGITPTFPSTGYGYIQQGESLGTFRERDVFHVLRFKEKPAEEQAKLMLEGGDHAWNSGMFVWRVDRIMEEFRRQMPELYSSLSRIAEAWDTPQQSSVINHVWPEIKSQTIDYGVMEGAERVAVIPAADLNWSDVGSWDSLFEVLPSDENGNIVKGGRHIGLDSTRSLVYLNGEPRLVVTIGVSDLVLVDTGDVLLVCPKEQAQKVREVVNLLKDTGQDYV
jgi:mannose-1-phosphate guanylyltransferase